MPKPCVVPKCKTGYKSEKAKRSVFRVPKEAERLKKWQAAIPGNVTLRATHVVCDKHFEERYIHREWIKYDPKDAAKIIARAPYKYPQLSELAVPTKFDENSEDEKAARVLEAYRDSPDLESPMETCVESVEPTFAHGVVRLPTNNSKVVKTELAISSNGEQEQAEATGPVDTADTPDTSKCKPFSTDNNRKVLPMEVTEKSLPSDKGATSSKIVDKLYSVVSTVTNGDHDRKPNNVTEDHQKYSAVIPSSWSVGELRAEKRQLIVFSYTVTKLNSGIHVPVVQKFVSLDTDRNLEYFVYGRSIETRGTVLERTLRDVASLPNILQAFQWMSICNGLGIASKNVPIENAFVDYVDQWRHNDCTLISKWKRCAFCMKLRNRVNQRIRNIETRPTLKRINRKASTAIDQRKLSALLKKTAHERRNKMKAQGRLHTLTKTVQDLKEKIARIENVTLQKRCSELNIPDAQKLALKEIIEAAGKKDARGRRYTDEWIMLCMLMNIRSNGFYEFLRKNDVLTLPCSRTMRSYFTSIDLKCGFDQQFAELLKKCFVANKKCS